MVEDIDRDYVLLPEGEPIHITDSVPFGAVRHRYLAGITTIGIKLLSLTCSCGYCIDNPLGDGFGEDGDLMKCSNCGKICVCCVTKLDDGVHFDIRELAEGKRLESQDD